MVAVHDGGNGIAVVDLVVFKAGGHREGVTGSMNAKQPKKGDPEKGRLPAVDACVWHCAYS